MKCKTCKQQEGFFMWLLCHGNCRYCDTAHQEISNEDIKEYNAKLDRDFDSEVNKKKKLIRERGEK